MQFATNNIERMRIDASGNLGLGTTGPLMPFQLKTYGGLDGNGNQLLIRNNTYYSAGTKYISAGYATEIDFNNNDGTIVFLNAASGAAGAACTMNERMRVMSTGPVVVGATTNAAIGSGTDLFAVNGTIGVTNQLNASPGAGNPLDIVNRSSGGVRLFVNSGGIVALAADNAGAVTTAVGPAAGDNSARVATTSLT